MKKIILILVFLLIFVPLCLGLSVKLGGEAFINAMLQPNHPFREDSITVPPDFTDDNYWASMPTERGPANIVPQGQITRSAAADVDVFFIHPTSYLSGDRWNAPLFADNWAWEMVVIQMRAQASAFNACCDVYAPHYREATLWSFMDRETEDGHQALELAYRDVESGFDEFLTRFSKGRPFIIASHSQGTTHALRLISERINNTALKDRLVAAYLIGYQLPMDYFERELTNISPCESANDTGCVIHWATFGEGGQPEPTARHYYSTGWEYADDKEILCTNPLSWRRDETLAPASEHSGALAIPRTYGTYNMLFNKPSYKPLAFLPPVLPEWTWAQCKDGFLYVEPQLEGPFYNARDDEKRNYHTRDYSLFYQAIRENAVLRAEQFTRFR